MIRILNGICIFLVLATLTALYHIRYGADAQQQAVRDVESKIYASLKEQQILRAEWTSLNDPMRLQYLAQSKLGLTYLSDRQLQLAVNLREEGADHSPILRTAEAR